jgi:SAM-dependent methyltransferase
MFRRLPPALAALLLTALLLPLAACSSTGSSVAPPPTAPTAPTATTAPTAPTAATAADDGRFVHPLTGRLVARTLPADRAAILEREDRAMIEEPEKTLDLMGLEADDVVADLGAGIGWYSSRLAKRVPRGKVLAVDVQQGMLDQLIERMEAQDIDNVVPVLGTYDDPMLPEGGVDWILLVDVYHEMSDPVGMLEKMKRALRPGTGRVALKEYRAEPHLDKIEWIPRDHKMTVEEVLVEWADAGFECEVMYGTLPNQHFFVMKVAD